MSKHHFGGQWTLIKLDILKKYLNAYTTSLKKQNFRLLYIDAFAGSGEFSFVDDSPNLELEIPKFEASFDGSARIATEIDTPFDEYHFIEQDNNRFKSLEKLKSEKINLNINLVNGDANKVLTNICENTPWKNTRAVIFLDPYGMSVSWETLETISKTKSIDCWYLYPLSAIYRQAAHDFDSVDTHKAKKLDFVLGTDEWRTEFYKKSKQEDLFTKQNNLERSVDVNQIEDFMTKRLKIIFPSVNEPPYRLYKNTTPMFTLFFVISNPSIKALKLASNISKGILKSY